MNRAEYPDSTNRDNKIIRLFTGIACTGLPRVSELLQELEEAAPGLEHGIRVVPEENLHITLKFLGSADSSSIAHIAAVLDQIAESTVPFALRLAGADTFKDAVWLGIESCDAVGRLASAINHGLESLGFRAETRPFIPHLTLARLTQLTGPKLQTWLQQHQHETWDNLLVREIHLYQSETPPTSARYSILHTATFTHQN